jgi:hypothetical protein
MTWSSEAPDAPGPACAGWDGPRAGTNAGSSTALTGFGPDPSTVTSELAAAQSVLTPLGGLSRGAGQ